jgi:hypothetical protein
MPDENSLDEETVRTAESSLPFVANQIAIVIKSSAMDAQNLTRDKLPPYKVQSGQSLRFGGAVGGVCM